LAKLSTDNPIYFRFGGRFFALNDCYDRKWRQLAKEVGVKTGISSRLHEGVYTMLGGPNFETVAELKMLKICGVDAVGEQISKSITYLLKVHQLQN